MRVKNLSRNNVTFNGMWNNKLLLKGLEKISEHGTSFAAGTSLAMSLIVRPLAIAATPDTEKENKQYAISNSVCSGIVKFGMVEAVALPVENAVKRIDGNPERFLKLDTIKTLKNNASSLVESQRYRLGTQILKLGTTFITAVPKSVLTVAFIPIIMDKLFQLRVPQKNDSEVINKTSDVTFKGALPEKLSGLLGKILDNKKFQSFLMKNEQNEKNIAKHITAATDVLLTGAAAYRTGCSEKIKSDRKKALIYNNVISTAITLGGGYGIDSLIKEKTDAFITKFSKVNAADPKLHKYIEGINILRPAIIFALIYYGILPMFSTYIAEKVDKYISSKEQSVKS